VVDGSKGGIAASSGSRAIVKPFAANGRNSLQLRDYYRPEGLENGEQTPVQPVIHTTEADGTGKAETKSIPQSHAVWVEWERKAVGMIDRIPTNPCATGLSCGAGDVLDDRRPSPNRREDRSRKCERLNPGY
jgi:hypothetical protein